jgi:hypothetical protein
VWDLCEPVWTLSEDANLCGSYVEAVWKLCEDAKLYGSCGSCVKMRSYMDRVKLCGSCVKMRSYVKLEAVKLCEGVYRRVDMDIEVSRHE